MREAPLCVVAEDDLLVRTLVGELVKSEGIETVLCANPPDAIACLSDHPNLVITDHYFHPHNLTGLDIIQQGRQVSPNSLFVVISSDYSLFEGENRKILRGAGCHLGLRKPFSVEDIGEIAKHCVSVSEMIREGVHPYRIGALFNNSPLIIKILESGDKNVQSKAS